MIEKKISCPECHGRGGEVEPVLDFGQGPFIECWLCKGDGKVGNKQRGIWLNYKKWEKNQSKIK